MRYIVTSTMRAEIWPQTLAGLTSALKSAMKLSKERPDEIVTIAIHEKGSPSVPFRKFKDQAEIWRSDPVGEG